MDGWVSWREKGRKGNGGQRGKKTCIEETIYNFRLKGANGSGNSDEAFQNPDIWKWQQKGKSRRYLGNKINRIWCDWTKGGEHRKT